MGGADKINTTKVKNSDLLNKLKYHHKKRKNLRSVFYVLLFCRKQIVFIVVLLN